MNTSKDDSYALDSAYYESGTIARVFGSVKCRDSKGHRVVESFGYPHIAEGAEECNERIEEEYVGKTKNNPMFLTLSLDESRKLSNPGDFGFWGTAGNVVR